MLQRLGSPLTPLVLIIVTSLASNLLRDRSEYDAFLGLDNDLEFGRELYRQHAIVSLRNPRNDPIKPDMNRGPIRQRWNLVKSPRRDSSGNLKFMRFDSLQKACDYDREQTLYSMLMIEVPGTVSTINSGEVWRKVTVVDRDGHRLCRLTYRHDEELEADIGTEVVVRKWLWDFTPPTPDSYGYRLYDVESDSGEILYLNHSAKRKYREQYERRREALRIGDQFIDSISAAE